MINPQNLNVKLTPEEEDIFNGGQGLAMAKVMQTVVFYAEALSAERLADIEGPGHFVIPWASPGIAPPDKNAGRTGGCRVADQVPIHT